MFFGKLKGASESAVSEEAEELVRKFELEPKTNVLSKNLSGGMKRKLSMANAMVGGSSVIVLSYHAEETYVLVSFVAGALAALLQDSPLKVPLAQQVTRFLGDYFGRAHRWNGPSGTSYGLDCLTRTAKRQDHTADHPLYGRGRRFGG